MNAENTIQKEKEKALLARLMSDVYKRGDRMMGIALVLYFGLGFVLAFWYQTWLIAVVVGGLGTGSFFLAKWIFPKSTLNQYVASAAVAIYTAQFIYQMHGLFEMHFFAFIGSTLMITYQNWKTLLPVSLIVALHHGLFAHLEHSGLSQIYFTTEAYDMTLLAFTIHVFLAVVIFGICGLWSYHLEQSTISNTRNLALMEEMAADMRSNISLANDMANGKVDGEYQTKKGDVLGECLLEIRERLKA